MNGTKEEISKVGDKYLTSTILGTVDSDFGLRNPNKVLAKNFSRGDCLQPIRFCFEISGKFSGGRLGSMTIS